jgi:transposase
VINNRPSHKIPDTPKPEGGWRYSKLDPHRTFLERQIAEKPDITMPELAAEMAELGVKIAPASLSRWLLRHGYRYKKNTAGVGTRSPRHKGGA